MVLIFRILSPSCVSLNSRPLCLICSDVLLLPTANWEDLWFQGCTERKEIKDLIKKENCQDLRKEGTVAHTVSFYVAQRECCPLFGGGARYTPTCGPAALVHLLEAPWVLSGSKKVTGIRRTRWVGQGHVLVNGHGLAQFGCTDSSLLGQQSDFGGPTGSLHGWHYPF